MHLLDVLFPKRCLECGRVGRYVCIRCQKSIRCIASNEAICPICERLAIDGEIHPRCRTIYALDGLTACFHYDGIVKRAIKALKYRFVSDLVSEFVSFVPRVTLFELKRKKFDFILPIPLHASRYRFRGFNQSEEIAKQLATLLEIPLDTSILYRKKHTTPQAEIVDRVHRLVNMNGAFGIKNSHGISTYARVLLVDDVFTTGATMRAATRELKRAGVQFVWAVTMAR